jgi:hypothetical protein
MPRSSFTALRECVLDGWRDCCVAKLAPVGIKKPDKFVLYRGFHRCVRCSLRTNPFAAQSLRRQFGTARNGWCSLRAAIASSRLSSPANLPFRNVAGIFLLTAKTRGASAFGP